MKKKITFFFKMLKWGLLGPNGNGPTFWAQIGWVSRISVTDWFRTAIRTIFPNNFLKARQSFFLIGFLFNARTTSLAERTADLKKGIY